MNGTKSSPHKAKREETSVQEEWTIRVEVTNGVVTSLEERGYNSKSRKKRGNKKRIKIKIEIHKLIISVSMNDDWVIDERLTLRQKSIPPPAMRQVCYLIGNEMQVHGSENVSHEWKPRRAAIIHIADALSRAYSIATVKESHQPINHHSRTQQCHWIRSKESKVKFTRKYEQSKMRRVRT